MPQPTVELVNDLALKLERFKELAGSFEPKLEGEASVLLSYYKLEFKIHDVFTYGTLQDKLDVYYHDKNKIESLKAHFANVLEKTAGSILSERIIDGLNKAESIAREAYLCSKGDDYWPGYFSQIMVGDDLITLEQVNWTNAKSSSHKQDYMMRELKIVIRKDGNLRVNFSDRSSPKNRTCGDRIINKIAELNLNLKDDLH